MSSSLSKPGSNQSGTRARLDVADALVSMRTGTLLECTSSGATRERLEGLAATIPELFEPMSVSSVSGFWERLGSDGGGPAFQELLLVSADHVHAIQPLPNRKGVALVVVSPATDCVGLVLSELRAKVAALDSE